MSTDWARPAAFLACWLRPSYLRGRHDRRKARGLRRSWSPLSGVTLPFGRYESMRRLRQCIGVAGRGDEQWVIDHLPKGSSVHSAGHDQFCYVHMAMTDEDFRSFVLDLSFGIVDQDWIGRGLWEALRPLGSWCRGRKRVYVRKDNFGKFVDNFVVWQEKHGLCPIGFGGGLA